MNSIGTASRFGVTALVPRAQRAEFVCCFAVVFIPRNQVHISLIVVDIIQFKGYRQGTKKLYNALSRSRSSAFGFIQLTSFRWETLKLLTS